MAIPDRYDPDFMREFVDYTRAVAEAMQRWGEISDVPTRARFVISGFAQSETYEISGSTEDVGEVRDALLGLITSLQNKGIVRSIPQQS